MRDLPVISALTRVPLRGYLMASGLATSPVWVCGLPYFDQITVGIADIATDLVLVLFGGVRN